MIEIAKKISNLDIDDRILTVCDLYSEDECRSLISMAEDMEYLGWYPAKVRISSTNIPKFF